MTLTVRLDLPDLVFYAYNENPIELPISEGFAAYFGTQPPDVPSSLTITQIWIEASLPRKTYDGQMSVLGQWPVTAGLVTFNLDAIDLWASVSQSAVSGAITGTVSVAIRGQDPALLLNLRPVPGRRTLGLRGRPRQGPINLLKFVTAFLGLPAPTWLSEDRFAVDLVDFWASYSTAPGNVYSVRGGLKVRLDDTILGMNISLAASAEIRRALKSASTEAAAGADPETITRGSVSGTFTVNRFVVGAGLSFLGAEKTYTFSIGYDGVTLLGATSWIGKDAGRHQVLTVRLQGVTLGSIVEYFVHLANPNANYRLEAPWDFLNSIDLAAFSLVIDPTRQTLTLSYDVNLDLVFMSVTSVGLLYDRSSGQPSVKFQLKGSFLGKDYRNDPLEWDAANDSPPAIPGAGSQLFDLQYFGLGQHVTLKDITDYDSVAEIIKALEDAMRPADDPKTSPLGPGMKFDESSQWMLGIACTFMDTVAISLVMHDPDLYGILLTLSGPRRRRSPG